MSAFERRPEAKVRSGQVRGGDADSAASADFDEADGSEPLELLLKLVLRDGGAELWSCQRQSGRQRPWLTHIADVDEGPPSVLHFRLLHGHTERFPPAQVHLASGMSPTFTLIELAQRSRGPSGVRGVVRIFLGNAGESRYRGSLRSMTVFIAVEIRVKGIETYRLGPFRVAEAGCGAR